LTHSEEKHPRMHVRALGEWIREYMPIYLYVKLLTPLIWIGRCR